MSSTDLIIPDSTEETSSWVRSFSCEKVKPLIVCRGPVRKEAVDTFKSMGMTQVGILVSHKDSIVFPHALAPELREVDPRFVHYVADYTGATKEEREERIQEIIGIAKDNGYDSIFAGYGFMSEDDGFVGAIEAAELTFIGPRASVVKAAGKKDEAKRTALEQKVSVTPGVDDITTRLVLEKYATKEAREKMAKELDATLAGDTDQAQAESLLAAASLAGRDLFSIEELATRVDAEAQVMLSENKGRRIRLKAVGGGGGKGQRIVDASTNVPEKVREVLSEVKALGPGDDKNMLLELNVEKTRHQEIQLLGNGTWCVALGGRDCSVQMHEQKLLELSITREEYTRGIEAAREAGRVEETAALERDRAILDKMEAEAARFGEAVGLDSVSTFECIVEDDRHFFMEVNTRIQVEHRVTELCYGLRFRNPNDPTDYLEVHSLVEAMALVARHKKRLPEPERCPRKGAAIEARLNATDDSLTPHAGGVILSWSKPLEYETRDDQGISVTNPDTGAFMRYALAGAYDSNIALLVTHGKTREESFKNLSEILRVTKLRGIDLATNLEFHYGLVNWLRGTNVRALPTTAFVVPYLTQVGLLAEAAGELDFNHAWTIVTEKQRSSPPEGADAAAWNEAVSRVAAAKQTLIRRPIEMLLQNPHVLSGWLSLHRRDFHLKDGKVCFKANPLVLLQQTYHDLNMDFRPDVAPAHMIWAADHEMLQTGLRFYSHLEENLGIEDFDELQTVLQGKKPKQFDEATWLAIQAAHAGHQFGAELLALVIGLGVETEFFDLDVEPNLEISIPDRLRDPELQKRAKRALAPPPATRADQVVAAMGGMYYGQEGPGRPPFVKAGDHFEVGQTLYIIEVMKMFNRVTATFAGTVDKVLAGEDGTIVRKGQPLFDITPDERVVEVDPADVAKQHRERTESLLQQFT